MKKKVKRFTKEEEKFILEQKDKMNSKQIANALGRTYSSIAHYKQKINNGFKYPQKYRNLIEVKCSFCKNNLKRRADIKSPSGRYFCNNVCKNMFYAKSIEDLNNWNKITNKMIKIFGKKCWLCSYDKIIQGHHLKEKSNGGENKCYNCFLCCPNHHSEIHEGIIKLKDIKMIMDEKLNKISLLKINSKSI
jgi:hypothetical protein